MAVHSLSYTLLTFFLIAVATAAKNSAPAPAADCNNLVLNLADCLTYVIVGSTTNKPEGTCCSGLKTVLKTDAECLCEGFKNSAQLGVTLNMTKALALPSACHVSAPPVSDCGLDIGSIAAPAPSPMAASPTSVPGAPAAGIGGEVSPAAAPSAHRNSGTSLLPISILLLVFPMLAAVSYALF